MDFKFILLTLLFFLIVSYTIVLTKFNTIKENWSENKCNPFILPFAGLFRGKEDGRTATKFASDNFGDCTKVYANNILKILLAPVYLMLERMTNTALDQTKTMMNTRALGSVFTFKFMDIIRNYLLTGSGVFYEFRKTYYRLFNSFNRIYAIAIATTYQGVSLLTTLFNFQALMVRVAKLILLILIAMIIIIFLFLWPIIPVILMGIAAISASIFATEVTGMSSIFCFDSDTKIKLVTGEIKPIHQIVVGDKLIDGGIVHGAIKIINDSPLYDIDGIKVSGSHLYFDGDKLIPVKDYNGATQTTYKPQYVYTLVTSSRKIPIQGDREEHLFGDWEEIAEDDIETLELWNQIVAINNRCPVDKETFDSYSALEGHSLLELNDGSYKYVKDLKHGDILLNGNKLLGIGELSNDMVEKYVTHGAAIVSESCWIPEKGQIGNFFERKYTSIDIHKWYALLTSTGKIELKDGLLIRDFTEYGGSYEYNCHLLELLNKKK